jgi:hypothetical protein
MMGISTLALMLVCQIGAPHIEHVRSDTNRQWSLSAEAGAGQLGDVTALWTQPRFTLHRDQIDLVLALPLWVGMTPEVKLLNNVEDPETWAALIEYMSLRNRYGDAEIYVGALRGERFGHGSLVDQYTGRIDPMSPRTGARIRYAAFGVSSEWMVNSIVNPQVMGGHLEAAPLSYFGWDKEKRYRMSLGGMLDVGTPLGDHRSIIGGLNLGLSGVVWRNKVLGFELYANGVVLAGDKFGGHFGLLTEWRRDSRRSMALTVRAEAVVAGEGYVPGYFDMAYEAERVGLPGESRGAKGIWKTPSAEHVRLQSDFRMERMLVSASVDVRLDGEAKYALMGHYESAQWGLAGMLMQRHIQEAKDVVAWNGQTAAMLEVSGRLYRNLYGWARLYRGWHEENDAIASMTAWSVGIGYGMARLFK